MNSKAFTPEEIEKGLDKDLLNYLLDYNSKSSEHYYDIHICSDGFCTIVEWNDISYNPEMVNTGEFKLIDDEHVIAYEGIFPDNHIELCYNEDDYNERLNDWLKEHPTYRKNTFGRWYDSTAIFKEDD